MISESNVRYIVRLLGEVAVAEGPLGAKKQLLMDGLTKLIKADCWVWVNLESTDENHHRNVVSFLHGGFSEERLAAYFLAQEHPEMDRYNAPLIGACMESGKQTTLLRQQIDPDNTFPRSEVYPSWQKADISPILLSAKAFPNNRLSLIGLYRREQDALFDADEAQIAQIVLSEVPWLHAASWPEIQAEQPRLLSPRLNTVLRMLLEGLGRKQIAAHLELSENTISGYVKQVYRHYGVRSHAELMKRLQHGANI